MKKKKNQKRITFKEQLEKIKNEKIQKSKNEELFKEYELKFNPEKFTQKLKNEFQFFRKNTFKDFQNNEDKKIILYNYELNNNGMKPSQRIIQNILRREKNNEIYDKSLFNLNE